MKKFRFQLETLLKVTRMKKEEAEVAFAEAVRRLDEARARPRRHEILAAINRYRGLQVRP